MADTGTEIRIRIDEDDDLAAIHEAAADSDVEVTEVPGDGEGTDELIAPVMAVLIGAGVLSVARFVTVWWEKRRGGLVIDLRPGAADQISRDRDVPWGHIVVFAKNGEDVEVQTKDMPKDAIDQLLAAVISGAYETAQAVAEAAAKAAGTGAADDDTTDGTTAAPAPA